MSIFEEYWNIWGALLVSSLLAGVFGKLTGWSTCDNRRSKTGQKIGRIGNQ